MATLEDRPPCTRCGKHNSYSQFHGKDDVPVCSKCHMSDLSTPAAEANKRKIVDSVQTVEPSVPEDTILAIVSQVVHSLNGLTQLTRQVTDSPDILLGSQKATKNTCRLISSLKEAGAKNLALPRCTLCGKEAEKRYLNGRICKRCYSRYSLVEECSRCSRQHTITSRTEAGEPVCNSCWLRELTNHEPCTLCGEISSVSARTEDGNAVCRRCYDARLAPLDKCDVCGEPGRINSRKGGRAVCRRCYESPKRPCGKCGRLRVIASKATEHTPDICNSCWNEQTTVCDRCGETGSCTGTREGTPLCLSCRLADRIEDILTGPDGKIPASFLELRDAIVAVRDPKSSFQWLYRKPVNDILKRLASGEASLSHEMLDELPDTAWLRHLRAILVASGSLPERNDELLRLERRISEVAASIRNPEDSYILRVFGVWDVLRRVRYRLECGEDSVYTIRNARRAFLEAARFVRWLNACGKEISECAQADIEAYLSEGVKARFVVGQFVVWAVRQGVLDKDLSVPATHGRGELTSRVDFEEWLSMARRLLSDDSLDTALRVAGALVVIYAQPVTRVARLTTEDVTLDKGQVYLRLGEEPVLMPEPLGSLLAERPWRQRGGVSGVLSDDYDWLFPGARAGRHVHPEHLRTRMAEIGIECRKLRSASLTQLAAELPAAVLADMLGIHPNTATRWVERTGGNWGSYAARRAREESK